MFLFFSDLLKNEPFLHISFFFFCRITFRKQNLSSKYSPCFKRVIVSRLSQQKQLDCTCMHTPLSIIFVPAYLCIYQKPWVGPNTSSSSLMPQSLFQPSSLLICVLFLQQCRTGFSWWTVYLLICSMLTYTHFANPHPMRNLLPRAQYLCIVLFVFNLTEKSQILFYNISSVNSFLSQFLHRDYPRGWLCPGSWWPFLSS